MSETCFICPLSMSAYGWNTCRTEGKRRVKCQSYTERQIKVEARPTGKGRKKKKEVSGIEMIEYMRRNEILRDAPGAEALKTPHRQQNLASFFTQVNQYTGQSTDMKVALRKTSPGLIKDKTVSANAKFRDISLGSKGGAPKRVQSGLVRAEKNQCFGTGRRVKSGNWGLS